MSDTPRTDTDFFVQQAVDRVNSANACKHGQLARVCQICDLERENAELRQKLSDICAEYQIVDTGDPLTDIKTGIAGLIHDATMLTLEKGQLRERLSEWAREAHEALCFWSAYADRRYQDKWGLTHTLAKWKARETEGKS